MAARFFLTDRCRAVPSRRRFRKELSRRLRHRGRELSHRLGFASKLKSEVFNATPDDQLIVFEMRVVLPTLAGFASHIVG